MKRMLQIVSGCLILFFFFMGNDVYAQDIEGFNIWSTVTKAQIIGKFGTPDKYKIQRWAAGDGPYEKGEFFRYDIDATDPSVVGLRIVLMDDHLDGFNITNSKYRAFTNDVQGGVRVGDPFSIMEGFFTPDTIENKDGGIEYKGFTKNWNTIYIFVKENKICKIVCGAGE